MHKEYSRDRIKQLVVTQTVYNLIIKNISQDIELLKN